MANVGSTSQKISKVGGSASAASTTPAVQTPAVAPQTGYAQGDSFQTAIAGAGSQTNALGAVGASLASSPQGALGLLSSLGLTVNQGSSSSDCFVSLSSPTSLAALTGAAFLEDPSAVTAQQISMLLQANPELVQNLGLSNVEPNLLGSLQIPAGVQVRFAGSPAGNVIQGQQQQQQLQLIQQTVSNADTAPAQMQKLLSKGGSIKSAQHTIDQAVGSLNQLLATQPMTPDVRDAVVSEKATLLHKEGDAFAQYAHIPSLNKNGKNYKANKAQYDAIVSACKGAYTASEECLTNYVQSLKSQIASGDPNSADLQGLLGPAQTHLNAIKAYRYSSLSGLDARSGNTKQAQSDAAQYFALATGLSSMDLLGAQAQAKDMKGVPSWAQGELWQKMTAKMGPSEIAKVSNKIMGLNSSQQSLAVDALSKYSSLCVGNNDHAGAQTSAAVLASVAQKLHQPAMVAQAYLSQAQAAGSDSKKAIDLYTKAESTAQNVVSASSNPSDPTVQMAKAVQRQAVFGQATTYAGMGKSGADKFHALVFRMKAPGGPLSQADQARMELLEAQTYLNVDEAGKAQAAINDAKARFGNNPQVPWFSKAMKKFNDSNHHGGAKAFIQVALHDFSSGQSIKGDLVGAAIGAVIGGIIDPLGGEVAGAMIGGGIAAAGQGALSVANNFHNILEAGKTGYASETLAQTALDTLNTAATVLMAGGAGAALKGGYKFGGAAVEAGLGEAGVNIAGRATESGIEALSEGASQSGFQAWRGALKDAFAKGGPDVAEGPARAAFKVGMKRSLYPAVPAFAGVYAGPGFILPGANLYQSHSSLNLGWTTSEGQRAPTTDQRSDTSESSASSTSGQEASSSDPA